MRKPNVVTPFPRERIVRVNRPIYDLPDGPDGQVFIMAYRLLSGLREVKR
jgi:hypothetical protein